MNEWIRTPPAADAEAAFRAAFDLRYGGATPAPDPVGWNAVLDGILAHRSIRAYVPDPLPEGTLETLVAAAQSASSSSNLQTWSVVAVEDSGRRAQLAAWAGDQAHIKQAPLLLVFLADLSRAERVARAAGIEPQALDFLELTIVATVDAALAAQNAVLAAESLGLGTVYIGALRNRVTDVARLLDLPPHVYPVFGLVVGRPDLAARPADVKPRLPQSVVLHREVYRAEADDRVFAAYDATLHAFQARQALPRIDWTKQLSGRVATAAGLNGREKLRDALGSLGLGLR